MADDAFLARYRTPRAVALAYDERDARRGAAPRVIATGKGLVAEAIIARARAAGVPIHESPELVEALAELDLDQRIPPALYVAVAEVLSWVYRMEHAAAAAPVPGAPA